MSVLAGLFIGGILLGLVGAFIGWDWLDELGAFMVGVSLIVGAIVLLVGAIAATVHP